MLKEDLRDELIAVRNYGKHIAEATDPEVKAKLTEIQSEERHHADELMGLLSRSGVQDAVFDAEWEENKHPRRKNGQFGRGGSSSTPTSRAEMRRRIAQSAPVVGAIFSQKSARRELNGILEERVRSLYPEASEAEVRERVQRRMDPTYFRGMRLEDLAVRAGVIPSAESSAARLDRAFTQTPEVPREQRPLSEIELRNMATYFVQERNISQNTIFDLLNNPGVLQRSINSPAFGTVPEEIQMNLRRQLFNLQNQNAELPAPTIPRPSETLAAVATRRRQSAVEPPVQPTTGKKHETKKIGPLKAQIGVDYDKDLDTATKQMFGRKVSKEDVVKLAGGFNEMVKEFLVTADPFSNTISVTANWDANNPVQKMQRTIRKDSIHMDLFMLNNAFKGQNIAPRMLYQSAVMAHKMGIPSIETHAAGNAKSSMFNGYYTWARCGYDYELEPEHKRNLERSVAEGLCTQAEWNNTFSKYTHVSQFMTTKQGRDMWKQHGSDLYHAQFDTRPGSKSMKVLKAYLRECGVEI